MQVYCAAWRSGDTEKAKKYSHNARTLNIIALFTGIMMLVSAVLGAAVVVPVVMFGQ